MSTSGEQLRRGNSDSLPVLSPNIIRSSGAPTRSIHQATSSRPEAPESVTGETWRDFLRDTGEGSASQRSKEERAEGPSYGGERYEQLRRTGSLPGPYGSEYKNLTRKRVPSSTREGNLGKRRPTESTPSTPISPLGTASNPIDLTSPQRQNNSTMRPFNQRQLSTGSIILPPWQADDDVSECPVCKTPFTIWYRRHHCRKCGRVVCGSCSPHRITIPRQFIVHPPPYASTSPFARLSATLEESRNNTSTQDPRNAAGASTLTRRSSAAMSGGEVVRVCNPCVPDPNFSPPPQMPSQTPFPAPISPAFSFQPSPTTSGPPGGLGRPPPVPERTSSATRPIVTTAQNLPGSTGPSPTRGTGAPFTQPGQARTHPYSYLPAQLTQMLPPTAAASSTTPSISSLTSSRIIPPSGISSARERYYLNLATAQRALSHRPAAAPDAPQPSAPLPPRRHIKEEDECPVCGRELPPRGPDGDESDREHHVEECIRLYSASSSSAPAPAPPARTIPSVNVTATGAVSIPAATPAASAQSLDTTVAVSASPSAPLPPLRPSQHRMLVYHATEKDCVGEDGERQECVICFEEFEEGDEMGRLDCLCKFHRVSFLLRVLLGGRGLHVLQKVDWICAITRTGSC